MTLLLMILLPLVGTTLPLLTERLGRNRCAAAAALAPLTVLGLLIHHLPPILNGEILYFHLSWLPALGLDFSLRLDGLGMMFGLLITGIGLLVILYAR